MGAFDQQFMVKKETTFNTPVTVDRGFGYDGDPSPITPQPGRTESNPMRPGSRFRRQGRVVPYAHHAEGHVDLDWMNKGMGFWLEHLLGTVATTGSGPYVHTGTEGTTGALMGKSFTAQFNSPFNPSGTNQAITCAGGKVPQWSIGCDVDGMLVLGLDLWFASWSTATALATYSEPSSMVPFAWAHGVVTVGGSAFDLTAFNVEVNQNMNVDRRQIRGNTAPKEPTLGEAEGTVSMTADFDSLTMFNKVHSTTVAGLSSQIIGTWTNGADIVTVTIPGPRFDEFSFGGDRGQAEQELTCAVEWDGTNSPLSIAYTTADTTP